MQETDKLSAKIAKQLTQQKVRLQQMLELLQDELDAVKNRDGDKMLSIADKKELQLQSIRNADEALNGEDKIAVITSTPELSALKSEISSLLEECQKQNEVIYLTATQNQIVIEQVRGLLLGGTKNSTYDASGQKQHSSTLGSGVKA